jgi:hypothetical protein
MRYPDGITVYVFDRHDAIVFYPFIEQGVLDHQVPLSGRERILRRVGVLGAAYPDRQIVRFGSALAYHLEMAFVERLEPAYHQRIVVVPVSSGHDK